MEQFITFKESECWPVLKYILDLLYSCDSGTYVLSRSAYTPLSLKLYHLPAKEEDEESEEEKEEKKPEEVKKVEEEKKERS